ncbi:DUF4435 domain-containing protein [Prevotella sp. OH937_COT-195]|uniref:DUF4435 domain-containing protein n=1 Tax=Prevotella sp. OH937_COT-195 TaxID=2491051 RepID=UPI000F6500C4|nr:DUF4435 domain-containing protein [Prevotella sp. OH937_COT-195]RRD00341.1 DUF4435 domain-containing protein [Prevotella sp. OH937_COT-195]
MKRLKENISSKYVEAANRLRSKTARRRIVAYVESYDDVFFWRTVLSRFENETRYFEVLLPSTRTLERGKKSALMRVLEERVGRDMIACVDADYDYLIQGASETSRKVVSNPYVFHTFAYSIENLQCYAPSLHNVCVAVTLNDSQLIDLVEFMRQYSTTIFPLFVWSIWHYRRSIYNEFTITDFNHVIDMGGFNLRNPFATIFNVRRKVARRIAMLQRRHPDAKESYLRLKKELITELGVTPADTYLYIQGHHLFDKVVMPILGKICSQLIREREMEIRRQSIHKTQMRNELSCYSHSTQDIEQMLKKNLSYVMSEPFRRILQSVEEYLAL